MAPNRRWSLSDVVDKATDAVSSIFPAMTSTAKAVEQDPMKAAMAAMMASSGDPTAAAAMMAGSGQGQPVSNEQDASSWLSSIFGGGSKTTPQARDPNASAFSWSDIIGPAIMGTTGLVGGIWQSDAAEEMAAKELERQNLNQLMGLQLEALKAKHLQPVAGTPVWAPGGLGLDDRVNARQSASNSKVNQLNAIINAYQNAVK